MFDASATDGAGAALMASESAVYAGAGFRAHHSKVRNIAPPHGVGAQPAQNESCGSPCKKGNVARPQPRRVHDDLTARAQQAQLVEETRTFHTPEQMLTVAPAGAEPLSKRGSTTSRTSACHGRCQIETLSLVAPTGRFGRLSRELASGSRRTGAVPRG